MTRYKIFDTYNIYVYIDEHLDELAIQEEVENLIEEISLFLLKINKDDLIFEIVQESSCSIKPVMIYTKR